ncbi:hypothetical protein D3C83_211100 [compost metagenome]
MIADAMGSVTPTKVIAEEDKWPSGDGKLFVCTDILLLRHLIVESTMALRYSSGVGKFV